MALTSLENHWELPITDCELYFIDLIKNRDVSNMLEDYASVKHESPQVIVFVNDNVVYNASHSAIDAKAIQTKIQHR